MRRIAISLATVAAVLLGAAHAEDSDALLERFQQKLAPVLPGLVLTSVKPSPIPGLFEVMIGASPLYVTEDGNYVIRGDVYDLANSRNIAEDAKSQARADQLAELDLSEVIDFEPANGAAKHTLYVFTDIDCTYCRKLHKEINQLTDAGIAVRYLAFPRTGIDSESYDKAVAVWCSADRKSAITHAKLGEKINSAKCENPVAKQFHLGELMGVTGTPAVMLEDGTQIGGYVPAAKIIEMFKQADAG
ncbi:MAG: DsbC family protein [Gammaproteobacteria bacterium]|nr:DsbC family protein [Gammaproteobacteria bacterium]